MTAMVAVFPSLAARIWVFPGATAVRTPSGET